MSKVWILKEQTIAASQGTVPMDFTPALEFGELQFITNFDVPPHGEPSSIFDQWVLAVEKFVREFDVSKDFIILTGSPLSIFTFGRIIEESIRSQAIISSKHLFINILVWNRQYRRYTPAKFRLT